MNLQDIEAALDSGRLYVLMRSGKWWKTRRNGKTQTWKRDLTRFRIPIKYGFDGYGEVTQADLTRNDMAIECAVCLLSYPISGPHHCEGV